MDHRLPAKIARPLPREPPQPRRDIKIQGSCETVREGLRVVDRAIDGRLATGLPEDRDIRRQGRGAAADRLGQGQSESFGVGSQDKDRGVSQQFPRIVTADIAR